MKDKGDYKGKNVIGAFIENMDVFRDEGMGDIILGKPVYREIYVKTRQIDGMITIYDGKNVIGAFIENMDVFRDEGMGDIILGKPFYREIYVKTRQIDGMITIYDGNKSVTYQMARLHSRFKHLTNEQRNNMRPLLK
nr:hypothetical protein [Tanacetum cinerariifolium]